ncbi:hypothetical protein K461DRAFT_67197 [Myriangium duriaei CBS 260.36]|uniref:Uncharacterized protein n=1 Tax=Myriangium duriaei CBS 260.36 TaxID=1168546 RepID=A0A9P4IQ10_9PEZI|nr:hypothetical protein K461DRAFT_67197 [Myriangium duriaei CBS 260.36]
MRCSSDAHRTLLYLCAASVRLNPLILGKRPSGATDEESQREDGLATKQVAMLRLGGRCTEDGERASYVLGEIASAAFFKAVIEDALGNGNDLSSFAGLWGQTKTFFSEVEDSKPRRRFITSCHGDPADELGCRGRWSLVIG